MLNGTLKNVLIGAGRLFTFFPSKPRKVFNMQNRLTNDGMHHDFQMLGQDMWNAVIEYQNPVAHINKSNRGEYVKTKTKDGKTEK